MRQLTLSGHVYERATPEAGEPSLADVVITVQEAERVPRTATSDSRGFYTVVVSAGSIAITASKAGYVARVSHVDVSDDTVLNFSLKQG